MPVALFQQCDMKAEKTLGIPVFLHTGFVPTMVTVGESYRGHKSPNFKVDYSSFVLCSIYRVGIQDNYFRGPRIIATDRQAPRSYPQMIPLCSRFDSVLFTPKMSVIASYGNYSRSPLDFPACGEGGCAAYSARQREGRAQGGD
jgi:hypothetical protein